MKGVGKDWVDQAGEVFGGDFDAGELLVVADADMGEAGGFQEGFEAVDLFQALRSDACAVGETTGETSSGGFVPGVQAEGFGGIADIGLGEAQRDEGALDVGFAGSLKAWAIVSEIVGVGAVEDHCKPFALRDAFGDLVELGFAVVAAVGIVLDVGWTLELAGLYQVVPRADGLGDADCIFAFGVGDGRAECRYSESASAELLMGNGQHQGAVDAARKADKGVGKPTEMVTQSLEFGGHTRRFITGKGRRWGGQNTSASEKVLFMRSVYDRMFSIEWA